MSKALNPRVESELREAIDRIAKGEWTISETADKLIQVGIGVRESGSEPKIKGPLGLPRPFAKIQLGDTMVELRTEVDDSTAEKLTELFANKPNTAAREAIRLGVLAVVNDFDIEGPLGETRPFARIEVGDVDDPDIQALLEEMRSRL